MKIKKIITILTIIFMQIPTTVFAQTQDAFNLSGIIDNIINYQSKEGDIYENENSKDKFLYAIENLNNGNVVVAYSEFQNTIDLLNDNLALFMLSKKLYEIGFFSLGDIAISKISNKNAMKNQIETLKATYKPLYTLTKDEESYLAKTYATIYFNNAPEEAAFNLIKKTILLENSDYANFIMAQCMYECKQYNQALIYVNKAIEKNPDNSCYKLFKLKTLVAFKKYKEATKYIEENENSISVFCLNDFEILKYQNLSYLSSNDSDKKYNQIYTYYLQGNYYKVLKETKNILNFYKNDYKILTLQGMANLAIGNKEEAKNNIKTSYDINNKFNLTVLGMADCYFMDGEYKKAYEFYKKLFNSNYNVEALIKAGLCLQNIEGGEKKLAKLNKQKDEIDDKAFYIYYRISNDLFESENDKKKQFAIKSLAINILNPYTYNVLLNLDYKENNFTNIEKMVYRLLFSDNLNAEYYYFSALLSDYKENKKEAFYELKKAVHINPDYKPAIELMNKLQNELI